MPDGWGAARIWSGDGSLDVAPPTAVDEGLNLFDNFNNRTIALAHVTSGNENIVNYWGTSSSGFGWAEDVSNGFFDLQFVAEFEGAPVQAGVIDGHGHIEFTNLASNGTLAYMLFWSSSTDYASVAPGPPLTGQYRFRFDRIPGLFDAPDGTGNLTIGFVWSMVFHGMTAEVNVSSVALDAWYGPAQGGSVVVYGASWGGGPPADPPSWVAKTDWRANVWYTVRAEYTGGVGNGSPGTFKVWVWAEDEPMGSPLVTGDVSTAILTHPGDNSFYIQSGDQVFTIGGVPTSDGQSWTSATPPVKIGIDFDYITWSPPFQLVT